MTFNNIVSGDTVFIGSEEDINHLSPETPETIQLQTRATLALCATCSELLNKL